MKYKGKKIKGRHQEVLVLPRRDEDLVFIAEALPTYDPFDAICKMPEPPMRLRPGGIKEPDFENEGFRKASREYAENKTNWMVLTSLLATEDMEWETVDLDKPSTWSKWRDELLESDLTEHEIDRIVGIVVQANSMNDLVLQQARDSFLRRARRGLEKGQSS